MILMSMGDDDTLEGVANLKGKFDIGQYQVNTGQIIPRKGDAAIHHDPFPVRRRPKAIKREVHADLAYAAERDEHQITIVAQILKSRYGLLGKENISG